MLASSSFSTWQAPRVFDINAVGLPEHYDPLIDWSFHYERCLIVLAVIDSEFDSHVRKGL